MLAEAFDDEGGHRNFASGAGRLGQDEMEPAAPAPLHGIPDAEPAAFEVSVFPSHGEDFAAAGTGRRGEEHRNLARRAPRRFDEGEELVAVGDRQFRPGGCRRRCFASRIRRDE